MSRLERRVDALERMKAGTFTGAERVNIFPYMSELSVDELNDVTGWAFGVDAYWKPARPDSYYAGLIYRAMHGEDMPQGYDWLNEWFNGELPKGRIRI